MIIEISLKYLLWGIVFFLFSSMVFSILYRSVEEANPPDIIDISTIVVFLVTGFIVIVIETVTVFKVLTIYVLLVEGFIIFIVIFFSILALHAFAVLNLFPIRKSKKYLGHRFIGVRIIIVLIIFTFVIFYTAAIPMDQVTEAKHTNLQINGDASAIQNHDGSDMTLNTSGVHVIELYNGQMKQIDTFVVSKNQNIKTIELSGKYQNQTIIAYSYDNVQTRKMSEENGASSIKGENYKQEYKISLKNLTLPRFIISKNVDIHLVL